ncbi:signal peptidase I [Candidatus Enterococcus clewellii]|uniref:Signal peptidase I n=1 Tax=Candidatus Enterococcus clewellii TaxID=1834193 RepID=A0A242K581_9ENTE|nr:signal peptidase I [Enterococcus sp. 9E7_DIV0242]OTP14583.1 signal peptidase I [Enterococcus sp. 9E7_DIV0242]
MSDSRKKEKNRKKRDNSEKRESTKKKSGKKKRRNVQQAKKRSGQKTRKVTDKRRKANSSVRPIKKRSKKKWKQRKAILIELGITLFLFLIMIAVLSKFTFTTIKVDGYSMSEQVNDKDRLFINRLKTPKRFSLLVFKNEKGEQVVRRVIGLPGERLYYEEDQLFVNESYQTERYLEKAVSIANQGNMRFTEDFTLKQLTGENSVPEDNYFVLGDNRQYSTDSRHFGFVDKKEIIGVVEFRFFPFHTLSGF